MYGPRSETEQVKAAVLLGSGFASVNRRYCAALAKQRYLIFSVEVDILFLVCVYYVGSS